MENVSLLTGLSIDHKAPQPVYVQIVEGIKRLVYSGGLSEGDKLPPVRTLAAQLDVNPNTVARSYRELESEGVVQSRVGRGTFLQPLPKKEGAEQALENLWKDWEEEARNRGLSKDELMKFLQGKMEEGSTS